MTRFGLPALRWIIAGGLVLGVLFALALWRGGLLDLPPVPAGVTAEQAGLADRSGLASRAARLERVAAGAADSDSGIVLAGQGVAALRRGELTAGLDRLRLALRHDPTDLVIGNTYRMEVLRLRRAALVDTASRTTLAAQTPAALAGEPRATLEALRREHPGREVTLQLALAWVDELLLEPALEVQAPASVESAKLLTALLATDPVYVPALYGRGLNYLNRPARLVWPEARKVAPDAASRDIGLCVAVGRRIGGAPPRLVATLALTLGDAYAHEGHAERARSWWQVAENASGDSSLRAAARIRFAWRDDTLIDQLEAELERRRLDLDHPLSDLSILWQ